MLRQEIISAYTNVRELIEDSNAFDAMQAVRGPSSRKDISPNVIIEVYSRIRVLAAKFGEAELAFMDIFQLSPILESEFWSSILVEQKEDTRQIQSAVFQGMIYLDRFFPSIVKLLGRDSDDFKLEKEAGDSKSSVEILNVRVLEEKEISTPDRVILVLQSIRDLYDVSAQLLGLENNSLTLEACDSGSDKSFDFLGVAQIVTSVKEIILSLWDKIVYYREDKSLRNLEVIAESLPVLDKIASMSESNKIGPELAEILRRKAISGIVGFAKAGVTIPEIYQYTTYNPRLLMKPEPKLLLPPMMADSKDTANVEGHHNQTFVDKKPSAKPKTKKINQKPAQLNTLNVDDPKLAEFLLQKIEEYNAEKNRTNKSTE